MEQELTPYLFAFEARQRGAIGDFYPIRRCLALPKGEQSNMLEIVTRCPDLEIRSIALCCEMTNGQNHPAPEGPTAAYMLINDTAHGGNCIGFIPANHFGDFMFGGVKEAVDKCHKPFVQSWTRNQLINFAKNNTISWIH